MDMNSERQWVLSTDFLEVTLADLTSGEALAAVELPAGAVIVGGEVVVDTAFDSATTDVLDVGDGGDDDRYTGTQINLAAAGRTALVPTGYEYTEKDTIDLVWTGTGTAPTTGSFRIRVEYIVQGRGNENQG